MATSYGYKPQRLGYGYQQPTTPVNTRSLALAAGQKTSQQDPFGLLASPGHALADGYFTPIASQASQQKTVVPATSGPGATPTSAAATPLPNGSPNAVFDINTDPALQKQNSYIGMNDTMAQSQALKAKQQELLGYGDPKLAAALFGPDDPFVQAAAKNPTSTLAQLGQQHDRGLTDMTENFNKSNLAYSGARVKGETQFGQDFQNALSQAAAAVNQNLSGIDSQLSQALAAGNQSRVTALGDAYGRHQNDPGVPEPAAAGAAADTSGAGMGDTAYSQFGGNGADFLSALALAAKTRRNVAV